MIGLLATRSLWFAATALFVINTATAGWFPIAQGQAYLRFPGRAGTVRTVNSLLGAPLVALPWFVGMVAGQFGVVAGLGMLGLAPILMLVLLISYRE